MKPFKKHYLVTAFAGIALVCAGILFWNKDSKSHSEAEAVPPTVTYQLTSVRSVSDSQDFTGRLEAVEVVNVRPKVPGTLLTVHFKDGQHVNQNDLLFTIDPAPLETEVRQAQAALAGIQERQRLAETEQNRARRLLETNSIAQKEFDSLDNAVRETAASLKGAQAKLAQAQLQLSYTKIRSPISGRISRAEITVGNEVSAGGGSAPLTRIVSDGKLYASFNVDEQSYLRLIAPSLAIGEKPTVRVGLANDSSFPYSAIVETLDNQMDTQSGTVRVRARINKISPEMLPGLQARIRLKGGKPYDAVMVDEAVVGTDQDRKYVLIVNAQNKVERRFVELGALQGTERVLRSGVGPNVKVLMDGAFLAPPGTVVTAKPAYAPKTPKLAVNGGSK